ncbi:MAG: hypothetical protein CMH41_10920, partial [Micrococcales bacterium]|nr:hypothetical protein [Micrococcales bacterium]
QGIYLANQVVIGESNDPADSYTQAIGTFSLPPSELATDLAADLQAAGKTPSKEIQDCLNPGAKEVEVRTPKWSEAAPSGNIDSPDINDDPLSASNATIVVAELNWKMYLAGVHEAASIEGSRGTGLSRKNSNFKCGYDKWDEFQTLRDWQVDIDNNLGTQFNLVFPLSVPSGRQQLCLGDLDPSYSEVCDRNEKLVNGTTDSWGSGWLPAAVSTG